MAQPHFSAAAPPEPAWDITFTRLTQTMRPLVAACALGLTRRFQVIGLGSDIQTRQTPRGLSTFLALVGDRGLICIVDMTLVDGMALRQCPTATLHIRLLDGCGDVIADGMSSLHSLENTAAQALISVQLNRAALGVYVAALVHFDLLRPVARQV